MVGIAKQTSGTASRTYANPPATLRVQLLFSVSSIWKAVNRSHVRRITLEVPGRIETDVMVGIAVTNGGQENDLTPPAAKDTWFGMASNRNGVKCQTFGAFGERRNWEGRAK